MTYNTNLTLSLRGDTWLFDRRTTLETQRSQLLAIARGLYALKWHPPGLPVEITGDFEKRAVREDWFEHYVPKLNVTDAMWEDGQSFFLVDQGTHVVKLDNFHTEVDPQGLADGLATVPFMTGCLSQKRFYDYRGEFPTDWYDTPSLPGPHYVVGLGIALRGRGHLTLVSRRWMTHGGPWRLLTGPNDTSLLQFYDLGTTDPHVAWAQAQPCLEGLTYTMAGASGIVEKRIWAAMKLPSDAHYDPSSRRMSVLAGDRKVSTDEMRELAEDRFNASVKPERLWRPLETIAYVFSSEARAKEHLHDLWLRELECWYEVNGHRTRLDDKYEPAPPTPPTWIHEAATREAAAPRTSATDGRTPTRSNR